ncbi:MAG TPA: class I SAM-dependent methyltransferase [Candidatus Brocadiia bacterium]|nr:class I SAM-dependent methyltransferase [Candidatus Brocadiia bacterium]
MSHPLEHRPSWPNLKARAPARWWDAFFGPDYLLMYGAELTPERSAKEAEAAVRAVRLRRGQRVLDACCGFGRHLPWLARHGLRLVGFDRSPTQMTLAGKPAASAPGAALARADARLLPFADERFDASLCLYTSLGYFGEDENLLHLREIARVTRRGGRLYVDNQNPSHILPRLQPERRVEDPLSQITIIEQFEYDEAEHRLYALKTIISPKGKRDCWFVLRPYAMEELESMLASAGFRVQARFGDYDLRPYGKDTPRLIVTAKRE